LGQLPPAPYLSLQQAQGPGSPPLYAIEGGGHIMILIEILRQTGRGRWRQIESEKEREREGDRESEREM
jgi:hypothetical protein